MNIDTIMGIGVVAISLLLAFCLVAVFHVNIVMSALQDKVNEIVTHVNELEEEK